MERTASATALPCAASTSTWRSLATISSGVCAFFRPIRAPVRVRRSHYRRTVSRGAGQSISALQAQDAPSAGALFNIVRTRAGSVASAIVGAVITVRERVHDALLLAHVQAGAVPVTAAGDVVARARNQAFVLAYADAYGLIALAALAAMLLVLLVREAGLFPPPIRGRGSC